MLDARRGDRVSRWPPNVRVRRAGGRTRANVEKSKTFNEGNDVEKPERELALVQ